MESIKTGVAVSPDRRIALNKLAVAVEKSNAKAVAKMFEGVSEAERRRVRTALLEIHGMFGWDKKGIKRSARSNYTSEECKKKCGAHFDVFVPIAVGGPRDRLDDAINKSLVYWPKETCKLLRDRSADWLTKYLNEKVRFSSHEEWMLFITEGVFPPVLDRVGVETLMPTLYKDANALKLKKVYKKFPWVSEFVYSVYSFENLVVNSNLHVSMLTGLLAFIEFLAEEGILDRVQLVRAILNGMHQVPKVTHVSACLEILKYLEPTTAEFSANQNEVCTALTNGLPQCHEFLLKQLERCCSTEGFDVSSACTAIASLLPTLSNVSANQACQTLLAFSQNQANRAPVLLALGQLLVHPKRVVAELGLKCISTLCSHDDKHAIQVVQSVLPFCSQVIKKQVKDWLDGQMHIPKMVLGTAAPSRPRRAAVAKIGSEVAIPKQPSEPLVRSRETIKEFRNAVPAYVAGRNPEYHLKMFHWYFKKPIPSKIETYMLFDHLVGIHFGMPTSYKAHDILALLKKCKTSNSSYNWWSGWLQSFTAAVALGDRTYAQRLANWMTFERGEADSARFTPGIYYLTMLLANPFREKKLALTRAMQMVLDKDKMARSWLNVYRDLEASSEGPFLENFEKAIQQRIELYESHRKAGRYRQMESVSEIGTLLWHAAKEKGVDVYRLSHQVMATILTSHSLEEVSERDPSDTLPSRISDERLNQNIALVARLFADCGVPYAITGPTTEHSRDEIKIVRRQIVMDTSEDTFQKLNQVHDPYQFCLSRLYREPIRLYEQPLLFDIKNVVGLNHIQLSSDALDQVLSMATPTKQNGTVVPTICNEHAVALACPLIDNVCQLTFPDFRKKVVAKTRAKNFDWKVAEQLAAQVPDALDKFKTIPKK